MLRSAYQKLPAYSRKALNHTVDSLLVVAAMLVMPVRLASYYLDRNRPTRLHVGCGKVKLQGWINADLDPRAQLVINIKHHLPFPGNHLDRIYSEHVLEHVPVESGLVFLKEAHRTLKSGGVVRIAMPDLDDIVDGYTHDWRRFDWIHWPGHEFIETKAEMINIAFRWWGHLYLYNSEELERRLREAGFSTITFCDHGNSSHHDLRNLETRTDSRLVVEATK